MLGRDRSIPDEREMRTVSGRVLAVQSNPVPAGGWVGTDRGHHQGAIERSRTPPGKADC